jgi:hypothetical protein
MSGFGNPFKGLSNDEAKALIIYALEHKSFHHTVAVCDLRNVMLDAAREKETRPAYLKIQVDDRIVMALRNPPEQSPYIFLLTAVPTQALAEAQRLIVLPGEEN